MIDVEEYCHTKATICRTTAYTASGKPVYGDPIDIKVYDEQIITIVINRRGQQVVSNTFVISASRIDGDDLLNIRGLERPVITASPVNGFDGNINHYEARC